MQHWGSHASFFCDWHRRKGYSDGAYIGIQNKGGTWPSEYIMTYMCIAINDLHCYVTMQSYCLQNVRWEREDVGQESLTIAILANWHFSTTVNLSVLVE